MFNCSTWANAFENNTVRENSSSGWWSTVSSWLSSNRAWCFQSWSLGSKCPGLKGLFSPLRPERWLINTLAVTLVFSVFCSVTHMPSFIRARAVKRGKKKSHPSSALSVWGALCWQNSCTASAQSSSCSRELDLHTICQMLSVRDTVNWPPKHRSRWH